MANRIETSSLMQRVSRDLYASPTAGVRELLANEITAARAAKRLGADPHIQVTVTGTAVVVWGVDSLGMERSTFDEIYTVLGRSGNFDGTTPGQFGLGRAAYVTIADHMLLETHHRGGDRYTALGVEGHGFQVDMGVPDIPFGTRITMAPRNGSEHVEDMEKMVREMAGRCEIPITLVSEGGTEELREMPLGGDEDYYVRFEAEDFECAVHGGTSNYSYDTHNNAKASGYLCGIPIGFTYRGRHKFLNEVYVDIHDERVHSPVPSRDTMTEEAEHRISGMIDELLDGWLARFPDGASEAMAHGNRWTAFNSDLQRFAWARDDNDWWNDGGHTSTATGNVKGSPILDCEKFAGRKIRPVLERFPDAAFVKNYRFPGLDSFMKEHGIEPERAGSGPGRDLSSVLVYGGRKYNKTHHYPYDTPFRLYRADSRKVVGEYMCCAGLLPTDTYFTVQPVDLPNIRDALKAAHAATHRTSRGMMTGEELVQSGVDVYHTARLSLVDAWGDGLVVDGRMAEYCRGMKMRWVPRSTERSILVYLPAGDGGAKHMLELLNVGESRTLMKGRAEFAEWVGESAMETFLRLDDPFHRLIVFEGGMGQTVTMCAELMRREGKEPVAHDDGCECRYCN